ncbi:hypothetical protein QCA50_013631 [Cerrena zonata]|uniref:Peptidase metallopeptidase domain-containing protein n=1 Tax=Cerrena zonata TaxID=2478898 RepID=A0AAW0FV14_9APHY
MADGRDARAGQVSSGCMPVFIPLSNGKIEEDEDGENSDDGQPYAVVAPDCNLWENYSRITFSFFDGNGIQRAKVHRAILKWAMYINLTFVECQSGGDIRIGFDEAAGSWSTVGTFARMVGLNEPTMNLGWINAETESTIPAEEGVILHEFGHALGLLHEHQSPARHGVLTFNATETIRDFRIAHSWTHDMVEESVLHVWNQSELSSHSRFDTRSIMMYSIPGTITEEGNTIQNNNVLSDLDKAYVILYYPRSRRDELCQEWTISRALELVGVDGEPQKNILKTENPDSIRQMFIQWNENNRTV